MLLRDWIYLLCFHSTIRSRLSLKLFCTLPSSIAGKWGLGMACTRFWRNIRAFDIRYEQSIYNLYLQFLLEWYLCEYRVRASLIVTRIDIRKSRSHTPSCLDASTYGFDRSAVQYTSNIHHNQPTTSPRSFSTSSTKAGPNA